MGFSEKVKEEARRKSGFRCVICQEPFVEVHHIIPQNEGGEDTIENAAPPLECICREIKEEFDADIKVGSYLGKAKFQIDHKSYEMSLYEATLLTTQFKLSVHEKAVWAPKTELLTYQLAPVDEVLVKQCFGGE